MDFQIKDHKQKKPRQNLFEKYHAKYDFDPLHITLDTPIPEGPKKTKKPNKAELQKKQNQLRLKLQKLRQRKQSLFAKPGQKHHKGDSDDVFEVFYDRLEDVRELRQRKKELFDKMNQCKEQWEDAVDEIQELRKNLRVLDKGNLNTREGISKEIKSLQLRQMRDKLNTRQEHEIMNQIVKLEQMSKKASPEEQIKKEISILEKKIQSQEKIFEAIKKDKQAVSKELNDLDEKLILAKDSFEKARIKKEAKQNDNKHLKQAREEKKSVVHQESERLKGEISDVRDQIENLWNNYFKVFEDYVAYRVHSQWAGWAERQKNRIRRSQEENDQQKFLEEEQAKRSKINPNLERAEAAENLLDYICKLMPKEEKNEETQKQENREIKLGDGFEGMQVISKKKPLQEDTQPRGKKKGKDKRKKEKEEILVFSFDQIKIFQDIEVAIPKLSIELERTKEMIQKRIKEIREAPWP